MRNFLWVVVCLCFAATAFGQGTGNGGNEERIVGTTLAREEKDGTITEDPDAFVPHDIPIICYVNIRPGKLVMVKMVVVAVKAVGIRPATAVNTVSVKADEGDTEITFAVRPPEKWAVGDYRVDVYLDGRKADSVGFKVVEDK